MIRTTLFATGALAVVALAVRSDYQWRQIQQQRREAVIVDIDDPALAAEVREAAIIRRLEQQREADSR